MTQKQITSNDKNGNCAKPLLSDRFYFCFNFQLFFLVSFFHQYKAKNILIFINMFKYQQIEEKVNYISLDDCDSQYNFTNLYSGK